jgi:AbrB family looped-hinge helix DNA binding protein
MANINVTRISSKGQIVIPSSMRGDLKEGDELLIIKDNNRFIIKKAENITEEMKGDLEFAKRTEEAWNRYEKGKFKTLSMDKFLLELEKC